MEPAGSHEIRTRSADSTEMPVCPWSARIRDPVTRSLSGSFAQRNNVPLIPAPELGRPFGPQIGRPKLERTTAECDDREVIAAPAQTTQAGLPLISAASTPGRTAKRRPRLKVARRAMVPLRGTVQAFVSTRPLRRFGIA